MFQGSFAGILKKLKVCFKKVSKVLQEIFKRVSVLKGQYKTPGTYTSVNKGTNFSIPTLFPYFSIQIIQSVQD